MGPLLIKPAEMMLFYTGADTFGTQIPPDLPAPEAKHKANSSDAAEPRISGNCLKPLRERSSANSENVRTGSRLSQTGTSRLIGHKWANWSAPSNVAGWPKAGALSRSFSSLPQNSTGNHWF